MPRHGRHAERKAAKDDEAQRLGQLAAVDADPGQDVAGESVCEIDAVADAAGVDDRRGGQHAARQPAKSRRCPHHEPGEDDRLQRLLHRHEAERKRAARAFRHKKASNTMPQEHSHWLIGSADPRAKRLNRRVAIEVCCSAGPQARDDQCSAPMPSESRLSRRQDR